MVKNSVLDNHISELLDMILYPETLPAVPDLDQKRCITLYNLTLRQSKGIATTKTPVFIP